MLQQFTDYIAGEWKVISQAPFTFIIGTLFLSGLAYLAARWRYAGRLETIEERIKFRDDLVADYRQKLQGASPDEARARIDVLEAELRSIANREWPHLTLDATKVIRERLEQFAAPMVTLIVEDRDGRKLANSLEKLFKELNWPVQYDSLMGHFPNGIVIRSAPGTDGSGEEQANALSAAIKAAANISAKVTKTDRSYDGTTRIDIVIGIRPETI
jgi:hypothetical protein